MARTLRLLFAMLALAVLVMALMPKPVARDHVPDVPAVAAYDGPGMLVVDLSNGTVIESNEAVSRLLQVPTDELNDTAPSWLQVTPEGGARLGWGALLDELIESRTVRGSDPAAAVASGTGGAPGATGGGTTSNTVRRTSAPTR